MESNEISRHNESADRVFVTREMQPSECREVFSLIESVYKKWSYTKFKAYSEAFPSSIFVTFKEDTREIVATVSTFPSSPGQYIIGVLFVKPEFRLKGLASALLNHVANIRTRSPATFTLISHPKLTSMYSKAGFQSTTPVYYRVAMTTNKTRLHKSVSNYYMEEIIKIANYTPDMFQELNNYDTDSRGYDLRKFLPVVINSSSTFLVAISKSSGHIVGYVAGLKTRSYFLIDGLYADDDSIALQLFSQILDPYPENTQIEFNTTNPHGFLTQHSDQSPPVLRSYTRFAMGNTAPMYLSKTYAIMDYTE